MEYKEYTFLELAQKQVVNIADGRQLGHICDLSLTCTGKICGLIVPGNKNPFKCFSGSNEQVFIPWRNICKVGSDVILVELVGSVGVMAEEDNGK